MKNLAAAMLLLAASGALVQTMAQEKPAGVNRLTIEDALRWRLAANPAVSPDGKRVAFLVSENDLEKSRVLAHLWWVDAETRQARRLTQADDVASDPRWSPDGRWLAFLSARGEGDPAKRKAQVWLLPTEGGEAFALTRTAEGVLHYRWAPDGKNLYYVTRATTPKGVEELRAQREKQRMDTRIVDDERPRREIWRVAVEGQKAERIFAGDRGLDSFEPSPDGKWIVYRTNLTGDPDDDRKYDLWLLELATGRARQLVKRSGEERSAVWSPDSLRLAFLAPRVPEIDYSQPEVFLVPVAAAAAPPPEPQRVTKDFAGNIEQLRWPAKANGIYFAAEVRTGNRLYQLDPASGAVKPASAETFFLTQPDWTPDGASCAAILEGPAALPDVVLLRAGTEPAKLTDANPQLKEFALGAQEVVRWKSKDGMEIEGIVAKPPDWQPGQKYPLLVDIHGGPYGRRANTLTAGNVPQQVWAARGWMTLQPNFRGSSGYGHEFGVANRGDLGGKDYEDILAGVDFLIAQGGADEKRLAVTGGSYGGYMTNWIIGHTKRFQAAASWYGIFSLITDFSQSEIPNWEVSYFGKFYWDDLETYLDRSPMKYVKQITTPVLILHGDEDNNTFIANSKELYQALKQLGRTVKFGRLPREGHGFGEPNHQLEAFRMTAAWLEEHTLGVGEARVRGPLEAVRSGAWEMKVSAVRTPASYAGIAPKGRYVEVELLLRAIEPTQERFSLLVFDTAGTEVLLVAGDRPVFPAGLVAESLGERILVKSQGQVIAVVPDKDGNHSALAVAVAFDAPADAREFVLRVKEFPPMRIELPAEKK